MLHASPFAGMNGGGNLTQTGNVISGIIHITGSPCFDGINDDLIVSGTATSNSLTFTTAPARGQTITFTSGTLIPVFPVPNRFFDGQYSITGGTCAQTGAAGGAVISPLDGNWTGTTFGDFTATATAPLTQTGPDIHGFYHLSGTFTFSNTTCFTSGVIASSTLSGDHVNLLLNTSDGGQTTVSAALLDDAHPIALDTTFTVLSGTCSGTTGITTLNKQ